jgi:hypothetical protein
VDDAVRGLDVCGGDGRVVDLHAVRAVYGDRAAERFGGQRLAREVLRLHLAGDHVQLEDRGQLVLVFGLQQRLDCAGGQGGEGRVGRGEHGKGAFAFQRINETGRLSGGKQRCEAARGGGRVDDVRSCLFIGALGEMAFGILGGGGFPAARAGERRQGDEQGRSGRHDELVHGRSSCLLCPDKCSGAFHIRTEIQNGFDHGEGLISSGTDQACFTTL